MTHRMGIVFGTAVLMLSVSGAAITVWLDGDDFALVGLPFSLVGALLLIRQPTNRIGWVLAIIGLLVCTGPTSGIVAVESIMAGRPPDPTIVALAWYGEWYWVPFLFLTMAALPLLLPTGEPASDVSRRLWYVMLAAMAVATALAMFQGRLLSEELATPIPNPVGWLPYGDVDATLLTVAMVGTVIALGGAAVIAILRRLRRVSGVELQQLRVIGFGVLGSLIGFAANVVLQPLIGGPFPLWLTSLVVALIPVSVLVAVLRYRLFELDRVVSRTVTYTVVSTVLIALYVVIAVVPSAVFDLRSDVLVAVATLAVAGAFVPVRQQVQTVVDRRFNRARYDAALVVGRFAERLRHQLDLDTLEHDISMTVATTMQPTHMTVWLARSAKL